MGACNFNCYERSKPFLDQNLNDSIRKKITKNPRPFNEYYEELEEVWQREDVTQLIVEQKLIKKIYSAKKFIKSTLQIIEYFEEKDAFYLILEFVEGGSLNYEFLVRKKNEEKFTEEELISLSRQLLQSCAYLNNKKIVHQRINLKNILLARQGNLNCVKLQQVQQIDSFETDKNIQNYISLFQFQAPEAISQTKQSFTNEIKQDIWSIGIVLLQLVIQREPFQDVEKAEDLKIYFSQNVSIINSFRDSFNHISQDFIQFLDQLLKQNPNQRPTAEKALLSPIFSRVPEIKDSFTSPKAQKIIFDKIQINECYQCNSTSSDQKTGACFKADEKVKQQIISLTCIDYHLDQENIDKITNLMFLNKEEISFQDVVSSRFYKKIYSTNEQAICQQAFEIVDQENKGILTIEELRRGCEFDQTCSSAFSELARYHNCKEKDVVNSTDFYTFITQI